MELTNYVLMPGADYQALCNAIRAKTGKTEALKSGELATEVESITGGGEVQTTEFLASTTFTNEYFEDFGAFGIMLEIDEATYNAWNSNTKPVIVQYDGEKYVLDPQRIDPFGTGETGVGVGNLTAFGGVGNDEPFAIAAIWDEYNGVRSYALLCGSMVDMTPTQHTIRIYQEASGSMEGVYTVTFMSEDGSAVLYERLVVDGDDCADVVDRGLLAAPTKESTAQYNYSHSGWSQTKGGSASASALKSVTADRTVYAAFASAVRYYTITYLDSDGTVLKTESLPYGAMPSYTPEKDGYDFVSWTPSPVAVTGDASYSATWKTKATFETATWAEISEAVTSGNAETTFKIGDERTETLTWSDGTTETVTLQIASFDNSTYDEKNGAKYMTLITKGVLSQPQAYHSNTNYTPSVMTPYKNSTIRQYLLENVLKALPIELQNVAKEVDYTGYSKSWPSMACYEKIAIPSVKDVGFAYNDSSYSAVEDTSKMFPIFTNKASKKKCTQDGTFRPWWIDGQIIQTTTEQQSAVDNYGNGTTFNPRATSGVYVCFKMFV